MLRRAPAIVREASLPPRLARGGRIYQLRPYSTPPQPNASSTGRTALISIGFFLAAAGVYYYDTSPSTASQGKQVAPGTAVPNDKYKVRVRGKEYFYDRLSHQTTETKLREHEDGQLINRKGNPVVRWDRNWVGSNEPPEDRSAIDLVPRSKGVSGQSTMEGDRDLALFSIFDGHAGDATSILLSKALHPTISLSLAGLQAGLSTESGWKLLNPLAWFGGKGWTSSSVEETLKQAFLSLDDNIVKSPVRLLPTLQPNANPDPVAVEHFVALAAPALAGACAISTVIDAENNDLYLASTGDCRAVAGWQDSEGKWRCDVLSEDQMGENPKEVKRMQSEHPASERDTVISGGRVQGGLQPTRAFGDAVYKWTRDQTARINDIVKTAGEATRNGRPTHYTPPYVTAQPEVTHRKLSQNGEKLRFVVMATDGLWDRITSEEATLLVASYLSHPSHPDITKTDLANQFPLAPPPADRPYPADDLPGSPNRSTGGWVFEGDKNAATHLIRNCLSGSDRSDRNGLLSMTGKLTRWFRDDITVTVVFFGDDTEGKPR